MDDYLRKREQQLRAEAEAQDRKQKLEEETKVRKRDEKWSSIRRAEKAYIDNAWNKILRIQDQSGILRILRETLDYHNKRQAYRPSTSFGINISTNQKAGDAVRPAELITKDYIPEPNDSYAVWEVELFDQGKLEFFSEPSKHLGIYQGLLVEDITWSGGQSGSYHNYLREETIGFSVSIKELGILIADQQFTDFTDKELLQKLIADIYLKTFP